VQRKLAKSSASVFSLIGRMAPVLIDCDAINKLLGIALSVNTTARAHVIDLLAVC